jgi:hypothetical protein
MNCFSCFRALFSATLFSAQRSMSKPVTKSSQKHSNSDGCGVHLGNETRRRDIKKMKQRMVDMGHYSNSIDPSLQITDRRSSSDTPRSRPASGIPRRHPSSAAASSKDPRDRNSPDAPPSRPLPPIPSSRTAKPAVGRRSGEPGRTGRRAGPTGADAATRAHVLASGPPARPPPPVPVPRPAGRAPATLVCDSQGGGRTGVRAE